MDDFPLLPFYDIVRAPVPVPAPTSDGHFSPSIMKRNSTDDTPGSRKPPRAEPNQTLAHLNHKPKSVSAKCA